MFKKILTSSLLFLIAIGGFFVSVQDNGITSTSYTNAACTNAKDCERQKIEANNTSSTSEIESKWLNEAIQAVNALLGVLTVIVSPAIVLAGWLMSPDWTSGDLFGLREPMHKMWVIVSNIVYFIYAILLIIIALATIFGKDNFNYKVMLPRLALGILMVPFTWWFVQWTISIATVVTASVINIPMDMIKEDNKYINGNYIPLVYTTTTTADGNSKTTDGTETKPCTGEIGAGGGKCTSIQKVLEKGGGMYSTLLIYAYQIFRIQEYKELNGNGTLNNLKTAGQLLNNIFIGAVMFLVFGLLVMALIAMLLLRAIKLWMYAIFSPLFTLHFVAGKELFGKSTEGFDIKEFIGLCFVPAVVGLSLSFGLMIISVIHNPDAKATKCTTTTITNLESPGEREGCRLVTLFGNNENTIIRGIYEDKSTKEKWSVNIVKIAGLTYIYKGKGSNADDLKASTEAISGGLSAAGGIFGTIIVDIIALIFIWMAFMAAKGITTAVDAAVSPFEEMGKSVGKMAMSVPKYIPIPGTGGQSAASLQRTVELGANKLQEMKNIDSNAKAGKLVPWAVEGIIKPEDETKIKNAIKDATATNIKPALQALGSGVDKANDSKINLEKAEGFVKDIYTKGGKSDSRFRIDLKDLGVDIDNSPQGKALLKIAKGETVDDNERRLGYAALKMIKGSGGKGETSAGGTTKPNGDGNGSISLGGINIDYNGIKDPTKTDEIANKISSEIKAKASTMNKPTIDEIKTQLDAIGMTSDNATKAANAIIEQVKDTKFKES